MDMKTPHHTDLIDLGSATRQTRGSVGLIPEFAFGMPVPGHAAPLLGD